MGKKAGYEEEGLHPEDMRLVKESVDDNTALRIFYRPQVRRHIRNQGFYAVEQNAQQQGKSPYRIQAVEAFRQRVKGLRRSWLNGRGSNRRGKRGTGR